MHADDVVNTAAPPQRGSRLPGTQGLVLRGGVGAGYDGAAGDGLSEDAGVGWTAGTACEFRVARSFAIGPQIDNAHVSFEFNENNYVNFGLSMNWYFIPE